MAKGRKEAPSYALIDSQSAKTVSSNENRGYDGGKKAKERKRHIVTDTMGNPLCVHVHAGNIHDTKGGVYTFEKALYRYPTLIGVRADQGYRGTFKNTFEIFHNLKVDISPRIKK
ncbi:MAG: transposase [Oscillospiraceae bacterium]